MRPSTLRALRVIDWMLLPLLYPAAWLLKIVRRRGLDKLPACRNALVRIGVFPIRNNFDEPRFDYRDLPQQRGDRSLPGIPWDAQPQLAMLKKLVFADELRNLPRQRSAGDGFHLRNGFFEAGDAEYWYQIVRALKPSRIFEIGSGHSTRLAVMALAKNREEDPEYRCRHVCIEPYRRSWLEKLPVELHRERVEKVGGDFFAELADGDLLFIDSSHMIRPDGDVLFEYLELLPSLNKGVVVHVHDIHTPQDYPDTWLRQNVRFWNEQYLLEALLTDNPNWRVLGALNYLRHHHFEALQQVAPHLGQDDYPSSFYLQKVR